MITIGIFSSITKTQIGTLYFDENKTIGDLRKDIILEFTSCDRILCCGKTMTQSSDNLHLRGLGKNVQFRAIV